MEEKCKKKGNKSENILLLISKIVELTISVFKIGDKQ